MLAYSFGIDGSSFQMFDSGMQTYSAKAPSASTPMIFTFWQMCASPVRHWKHLPQAIYSQSSFLTVRRSHDSLRVMMSQVIPNLAGRRPIVIALSVRAVFV